MKIWCLCLLLLVQQAHAQDAGEDESKENYDHVIGNPYYLRDWASGVIRFSSGRVMDQFRLKFDCVRNRLLLQFSGTEFAAESKVKEFVLYPRGKKNDSALFRKGYPSINKATEETYYQVLLEGKTTLLRFCGKVIVEDKQLVSSMTSRRLEDIATYYLLKNGAMILLPQDKNTLPGILSDHAAPLHAFIEEQQLKMRNPADFVKLIGHYNTLLQ